MTFHFHPEASVEYQQAAAFYESRRPGLGAAFTLEIEAAIQRKLEAPDWWRRIEQDVRTCRMHTFPFAVLDTIEADSILILAVMHLHRKPGYWHNRKTAGE